MKILLTTLFYNELNFDVFYDHFYRWLVNCLPKDRIDIKFIVSENYFDEATSHTILSELKPLLITNKDIEYIFQQSYDYYVIYEKIHHKNLTSEEEIRLKEIYNKICGDWEPDIIFSQGYFSSYKLWANIFPEALCLNQENAIFSRPPFNRTLSYDPINSVPDNCLTKFKNEINDFKITTEQNEQVENFKKFITQTIDSHSPIEEEMQYYKNKFDKLVLIPLIGNKYITLFKDCLYHSEIDLVEDVLTKIPKTVGVFVTQHDSLASLTEKDISYLQSKYSNFIYLQKTDIRGYTSNSLHYFKYIDAIINTTSKTAFMAMIWNKPVLSLAKTFNNWYKDAQGIEELDKILNSPLKNKNNLLYWYFTRYVLFEEIFSQENYLYNYLETKLQKYRENGITFNFFEEISDFSSLAGYVTTGIINNYLFSI